MKTRISKILALIVIISLLAACFTPHGIRRPPRPHRPPVPHSAVQTQIPVITGYTFGS